MILLNRWMELWKATEDNLFLTREACETESRKALSYFLELQNCGKWTLKYENELSAQIKREYAYNRRSILVCVWIPIKFFSTLQSFSVTSNSSERWALSWINQTPVWDMGALLEDIHQNGADFNEMPPPKNHQNIHPIHLTFSANLHLQTDLEGLYANRFWGTQYLFLP